MTSYFLSYDISNDRLRNRLAKTLERHGCKRIQKSLFLAPNFEPRELQRLRDDCAKTLLHRQPGDSLLCIPATRQYLQELIWAGEEDRLRDTLKETFVVVL
ncbi:MAG: CRISPR-associated endonuclease Cas2 [Saprospiraceae bacterium]|nr:CRISPR-associated endonuclease Cas2 [Saprospiraceae bacterium]